jgi:hypothetical protein
MTVLKEYQRCEEEFLRRVKDLEPRRSSITCLYSLSIDEPRIYMDPWVYKKTATPQENRIKWVVGCVSLPGTGTFFTNDSPT